MRSAHGCGLGGTRRFRCGDDCSRSAIRGPLYTFNARCTSRYAPLA